MSEPQMTSGRERPFCSENRTRKCHKIGVSSNFLFMVRSLQYVCVYGCVWVWVYVCVCVCVCVCVWVWCVHVYAHTIHYMQQSYEQYNNLCPFKLQHNYKVPVATH